LIPSPAGRHQRANTPSSIAQHCLKKLYLHQPLSAFVTHAVRKHKKMSIEATSVTGTVDEELADVLIFLCAIANRLGISIDDALRKKEALNETRTWK
jgi:NTP pyrophosphatase (non-canonical NTP hydrolase)